MTETNPWVEHYIDLIQKESSNIEKLCEIINLIYEDGFTDGVNENTPL